MDKLTDMSDEITAKIIELNSLIFCLKKLFDCDFILNSDCGNLNPFVEIIYNKVEELANDYETVDMEIFRKSNNIN